MDPSSPLRPPWAAWGKLGEEHPQGKPPPPPRLCHWGSGRVAKVPHTPSLPRSTLLLVGVVSRLWTLCSPLCPHLTAAVLLRCHRTHQDTMETVASPTLTAPPPTSTNTPFYLLGTCHHVAGRCGYCWTLLGVVGRCWVLLDVVGCCWMVLGVVGRCWVLLDVVECWVLFPHIGHLVEIGRAHV